MDSTPKKIRKAEADKNGLIDSQIVEMDDEEISVVE